MFLAPSDEGAVLLPNFGNKTGGEKVCLCAVSVVHTKLCYFSPSVAYGASSLVRGSLFYIYRVLEGHGVRRYGAVISENLYTGSCGFPEGVTEGRVSLVVGVETGNICHLNDKENISAKAFFYKGGQLLQVFYAPRSGRVREGADAALLQGNAFDL